MPNVAALCSSVPFLEHLPEFCDPVNCLLLSGNWVLTSLDNSGLYWTVFARKRDIAVPAEGNGNWQTLICVLVARPRRCPTLSNPVPWQNWMAAYLGYTLRMKILFRGWPIMAHDTNTRKRLVTIKLRQNLYTNITGKKGQYKLHKNHGKLTQQYCLNVLAV